ncbi:MAG: hypothetical protein HUJ95_06255, partial [Bacteroidales bacterium]|nr:hypothetical protein [Bacteroidales bacterium]
LNGNKRFDGERKTFTPISSGSSDVTVTASKKAELTGLFNGNGIGSDYAESNAPYQIKLDNTGDYIEFGGETVASISSATINWKMLGGSNSSSIVLNGSKDGSTFEEITSYTVSGSTNSTDTRTCDTLSGYIKLRWVFTKGSNIGVNVSVTYQCTE